MVEEMEQYFGSCTNHRECEAACPKEISIDFIAMLNRDYRKARRKEDREPEADRPAAGGRARRASRSVTAGAWTATRPPPGASTRASSALRVELERALRAAGDVAHDGGERGRGRPRALAARELDSLERVQPRMDSWLRVSVGAVSDEVQMGPVGEGPI